MLRPLDALRDTRREWMINRSRLIAALLGISLLLSVLVYRYYSLQITQHDDFLTQSDRNRIRVEVIPPTRGQIVDRKGRLLAVNKPTFVIGVVRERSENSEALILALTERLSLTDRELEAFRERSERRRPFESVPIKLGLDDTALARVAVDLHAMPGVVVDAQLTRDYPYGEALSHVLGYVGRVSADDLDELDTERYRGTLHTGKVGLEKRYEPLLHGKPGFQHIETNAHGRVLRVLEKQAPEPGKNLRLYLDLDLQREAVAVSDYGGVQHEKFRITGNGAAIVCGHDFVAVVFSE